MSALAPIPASEGLLARLVLGRRPDLADPIAKSGRIETAIVGLGGQGTRHAGLMRDYGTTIVGGVAPERGGETIAETIPVYDTVEALLRDHPHVAAVSVWRHFSSARDGALSAIEAGVPIVVLISEGIPLRDVRDVIAAARQRGTLLIGGNTPGIIFPPERIKIGMLPDVFHPEEPEPERSGPRGITILSRSGAILYHLSDALASAGIAQNGVIGVGGDGAIGTTFRELVPMVMEHEATDLVVVAGEIGGAQEEALAEEIQKAPERFGKPLVALLSGARAPVGKTMGHAGAVVAPGQSFGTFLTKQAALEAAGVRVVNGQADLIGAVRDALEGRTYFDVNRYYERMRESWEAPAPKPSWGTRITLVAPNRLVVAGYPLPELVESACLVETAAILVTGEKPIPAELGEIERTAVAAARHPVPPAPVREGEPASAALARLLLTDEILSGSTPREVSGRVRVTARALGRMVRYLARILDTEAALDSAPGDATFGDMVALAAGGSDLSPAKRRLVEALAVASVDHGVTPPSAQATILAATVRASFAVALASGVGAITDVHGGAGEQAARFFREAIDAARAAGTDPEQEAGARLEESARTGRRVAGLGHRVHTRDPRREVLLGLAERTGGAGPAVRLAGKIEDLFEQARGFRLPINVDGVIGAIVADLLLPPVSAKALFVLGRTAGLAAHYFEEVSTQPPMRRIRFDQAVYRGPSDRSF